MRDFTILNWVLPTEGSTQIHLYRTTLHSRRYPDNQPFSKLVAWVSKGKDGLYRAWLPGDGDGHVQVSPAPRRVAQGAMADAIEAVDDQADVLYDPAIRDSEELQPAPSPVKETE